MHGVLAQTHSDFNETKGAELALCDLLKSSSPVKEDSVRKSSRSHSQIIPSPRDDVQQEIIEIKHHACEEARGDCGPEGHDTPESIHYSNEEHEVSGNSQEPEDSKKKLISSIVPNLQLDQKLPSSFNMPLDSACSSIKPSEGKGSIEKEAQRAFLEDQDVKVDQESDTQPEKDATIDNDWTEEFTEFKTNINFEYKNNLDQ